MIMLSLQTTHFNNQTNNLQLLILIDFFFILNSLDWRRVDLYKLTEFIKKIVIEQVTDKTWENI